MNDTVFDVSLIQKFNKNDYQKTRVCRESIKPALQKIEESDLVNFSFAWANCFKYSIFHEHLENEIIPIILVLKKFARTNYGNRSLRAVLARKFVNFKVKFGILEQEELPSAYDISTLKDGNNDDLVNQNLIITQEGLGSNTVYQDSLFREAEISLSFACATRPPQYEALSPSETQQVANPFSPNRTGDVSDVLQSPK